jgi:ATP-dependent helicase YprA (DUF1998 family)
MNNNNEKEHLDKLNYEENHDIDEFKDKEDEANLIDEVSFTNSKNFSFKPFNLSFNENNNSSHQSIQNSEIYGNKESIISKFNPNENSENNLFGNKDFSSSNDNNTIIGESENIRFIDKIKEGMISICIITYSQLVI